MKAPLILRRWSLLFVVLSVVVGGSLLWQDSGAPPAPPCHEVVVLYEGRDFLYNASGLDFYRWHYKVMGDSCISMALSHWIVEVCGDFIDDISEVNTVSIDQSDPANGDTTSYVYETGLDPLSGIAGVKWEHAEGNELDGEAEYDTFSFVSPGHENPNAPVMWLSKGGTLVDAGYVIGPGCVPVSVEELSWGRLKAMWR
jgi:hypothetical protein